MHCDALTCGRDFKKEEYLSGSFQVFAAFTKGEAAAYAAAVSLFKRDFGEYSVVNPAMLKGKSCGCALSAENIGFTLGKEEGLKRLKEDGVIMASLVWNEENPLAYPNFTGGAKREGRGLKKAGKNAVEFLDSCGIILDLSHISDGGAEEILRDRKIPLVASHSCADGVFPHPRNLTDGLIKGIADCGGAVGVCFYRRFLGGRGDFAAAERHIKHIIDVAGEDVPAFGSDWEGVPEGYTGIYPRNMPDFLNFLNMRGLCCRQVEQLAYKNFFRVFGDVCGRA